MAEMRELALSVTDVILTINPDSRHWSYTIVNFQNCLITLDDPLGMPTTIVGIKQRLDTVRILKKRQSWAVSMQTARDERSRPFTFRVRVPCTQAVISAVQGSVIEPLHRCLQKCPEGMHRNRQVPADWHMR